MGPFMDIIKNKTIYGPILTIIVCYIIYNIIKITLCRILEKNKKDSYTEKRRKTVYQLVTNFLKVLFIVIALLTILKIYGIDTTSIIASLGVASAVIGLAFQDTLKDIIAGATIMVENYYIIGDFVKYNDFVGEVVSFSFKSTKIKNINNEILTVSNRNISEIINLSKEKAGIVISIPIAYEEEVDKVEKAINNILTKIEKDKDAIKGTATYLGINELGSSSVNYMIKFLSDHDKQWATRRKALEIIKRELDKEGIKIPYNQIEVHNGKNI